MSLATLGKTLLLCPPPNVEIISRRCLCRFLFSQLEQIAANQVGLYHYRNVISFLLPILQRPLVSRMTLPVPKISVAELLYFFFSRSGCSYSRCRFQLQLVKMPPASQDAGYGSSSVSYNFLSVY